MFPTIANEANAQLSIGENVYGSRSLTGILSRTHYRILTQVEDAVTREWYAGESYTQAWSANTLQRNIS